MPTVESKSKKEREVKVRGVPQDAIDRIKASLREAHGVVSTNRALRYAIVQFAKQIKLPSAT